MGNTCLKFLQDIASLFVTWTQTRQILKDKSNREGPQSFVLEWAALVQCPLNFSVLVVFVSVMGVCPSVICVLVKRIVVQMHCRMQIHCKQLLKKKPQELRSKPFRSFFGGATLAKSLLASGWWHNGNPTAGNLQSDILLLFVATACLSLPSNYQEMHIVLNF